MRRGYLTISLFGGHLCQYIVTGDPVGVSITGGHGGRKCLAFLFSCVSLLFFQGLFHLSSAILTVGSEDPVDLTKAAFTAAIDITSVQTDAEKLTAHLQKEEFFHTDAFPQATFTSTQIVKQGENQYEVTDLPRQDFGIGNDSYGNKLLDPLVPVDVKLFWK